MRELFHPCRFVVMVLHEQVHRQLHGYSTEMEMEQYMGGRLMGGSSSINGEQVRVADGWGGEKGRWDNRNI